MPAGSRPATDRVRAYVGLGANLGDRAEALARAVDAIAALPRTRVVCQSSLYRSAPLEASGPDYLNAVAEISTELTPEALLSGLQEIERAAGRERPHRHAPRTLDLDLLLYGDRTVTTSVLTVPHPRMWERAFVLCPLAEIAPHLVPQRQLAAVATQAIARFGPGPDTLRAP